MKNIVIRNVGSCVGNFIIMVRNAIHIALFYNYNVILPTSKFLNTEYLIINKECTLENEKIDNKHNFFYQNMIKDIDIIVFKQNIEQTNNLLRQCFTINTNLKLQPNDLVIHIRSGHGVFEGSIHSQYIQPPLSYYKNIIETNNFDTIYLVALNSQNPCINALLELYPNIQFKKQSLEDDINLILSASTVITGFGTFVPSLLLFSTVIKTLYTPSYLKKKYPVWNYTHEMGNIISIPLDEYEIQQYPWKNTKEQNERMLTYKLDL